MTVTERPRAAALSPTERRAAIVAATLPLLLERGIAVTTKQIADAAGIAEGTIFRVFPDKNALLGAVIDAAADTSAAEAAIAAIDRSLPIEGQIEDAVRILQRRLLEVWRVVSTVLDTDAFRGRRGRKTPDITALVEWFERHRDVIRSDPRHAARVLQGLTIGGAIRRCTATSRWIPPTSPVSPRRSAREASGVPRRSLMLIRALRTFLRRYRSPQIILSVGLQASKSWPRSTSRPQRRHHRSRRGRVTPGTLAIGG